MKLLCNICCRGSEHFQVVDFIDADGVCKRGKWCDNCRAGRQYICATHGQNIVVFIDNTSACRDCVEEDANMRFSDHTAQVNNWYKILTKPVPKNDINEFVKLVRNATEDNLSTKMCMLCALYAFGQRFNKTVDEVVAQAVEEIKNNHSLVAILLPSGDPDKKFKGQPPETS